MVVIERKGCPDSRRKQSKYYHGDAYLEGLTITGARDGPVSVRRGEKTHDGQASNRSSDRHGLCWRECVIRLMQSPHGWEGVHSSV